MPNVWYCMWSLQLPAVNVYRKFLNIYYNLYTVVTVKVLQFW